MRGRIVKMALTNRDHHLGLADGCCEPKGILLAGNKGRMDTDWITNSVCHSLQRSLG